jgi:hypothetical protein
MTMKLMLVVFMINFLFLLEQGLYSWMPFQFVIIIVTGVIIVARTIKEGK